MILDDAARLEALAAEVIALRLSQQHGQSLAHRKRLTEDLLARTRNAWTSSAAILQRLGEMPSSSPLFDAVLAKIIEWRTALDEDLSQALAGDLFTAFQDSAVKAVSELERSARSRWERYTVQKAPEISGEVLAALEADPRARSTVARIRHLSETLSRIRGRALPSPAEFDEFDRMIAELRSAWSTLDVASLSPEIVTFLRAANSDHGAPLELLTPSVREWLERRGAASHYVVRPADQ